MPSMPAPDLAQIDLNLLVALDALLAEGSVSAAARRLGVGQPAASHALARLRELLGDPLLVRVGRRMLPTARAEALRGPLTRLLGEARQLLAQAEPFDPATSSRRFALRCPDLFAPLLPALLASLRERAPGVTLELDARLDDYARALAHGEVDLALVAQPDEGEGLVARRLAELEFCVLARAEHPALQRGRLTLRKWLSSPHIVVRTGDRSANVVERALARAGEAREVGLVVPSLLSALLAAAQDDLFYAAPRALVDELAPRFGLRVHAPPVEMARLRVVAVWHERMDRDPAHAFIRARLLDAIAATLG